MRTTLHEFDRSPGSQTASLPEPFRSWAGTARDYPRASGIPELFEAVAAKEADATAIVCGRERLTYGQLNARANQIAWRLQELQIRPDTLIGVCLDRSPEMIAAVLAALKAGGAYLPLDPELPSARLTTILAEAKPAAILTNLRAADFRNADVLRLDETKLSDAPTSNLPRLSSADDLAYVMYTSGSTGQPKGVMVEQRSVVRLVRGTNFCDFGPEHTFLQAAPLSFDASTFEIWGALLNGSTLVLPNASPSSLEDIARAIRDHGVTTAWLTSGLFNLMVDQHLADLRGLRQLLTGGDVVSASHVRRVLSEILDCRVINGYGPTENTTFTCCHSMRSGDHIADSVPLGRPISNTNVYVLNPDGHPSAIGEAGELFAAGDGLARGYLNDPELTAARFLPDPFFENERRMYRTGDLVRWRENGVLEFLGRLDDQVKIRGHRVEPLEVEHAIKSHPGIRDISVTAADSESGKRLIAFYTSADNLPSPELRVFLQARLPEYMVPSMFHCLEFLPLTSNGKIDRDALRNIQAGNSNHADDGATSVAAENSASSDLSSNLQQMWRTLLRTEKVGLDDNFFDLGGDSLLLMSMHSRLQTQLSIKLPILDLFEFTTIRKLAERISQLQRSAAANAAQPAASDQSGIQQRRAALRQAEQTSRRQK